MALSESPKLQALRELENDVCAVCGNQKSRNRSFCYACFISLPGNLQKGLYARYTDGYTESYFEAKDWLAQERRAQRTKEEGK
jgi:hypothetical protein